MYQLRPYQERTLNELYDWLQRHPDGNPIVDACVGAGKSIIIAEFCRRAIEQYPQTRIVMCVASKELCQQNLDKLRAIWPEAPAGVCSASLGHKDVESQIIFATIGSIAKRAHELGTVNLLIVDECHNVNPDNAGMYRSFINDLKTYGSPYLCVIGFTGTPFRGDGVWLWQGKDPLFAGTATRVSMDELLEQGYLAPLVVDIDTPKMIDTSDVKVVAGDYVVKELEGVAIDPAIIKATVDDMFMRGGERNKWLIFCVTIDHAQAVLDEVQMIGGMNAQIVTSKTPMKQRATILENYKLPYGHPDSVNCLVNVACLTTGFDAPETDLIALLRPTKSPVLYVQIAGRGMRIADGKKDCLWLDYTSTTRDLGPVNLIKGRNKQTAAVDQGAPFKYCLECGNPNPIHLDECIECGAPMPSESSDPHGFRAGKALPLHGFQPLPEEWLDVQQIGYYKHPGKNGKPPTLRIDYYYSELDEPISEWKCFEHDGFALRMGCQWWADHMPHASVPFTVDEALERIHDPSKGVITLPTRILVQDDGKYKRVKKYQYGNTPHVPKVISYQSATNNLMPF
ncbi:DEAD/DEAH box helicase [Psychrobacter pygoscelis]|uniref:DEAD/DEAH box helicase n=1 Tax=Psychrobacter pygoscelis TaxID=2488563 RepID=UPI00104078BE|nr:DEAD/DEAH box helicase [Psychrobacter pygoscelis]